MVVSYTSKSSKVRLISVLGQFSLVKLDRLGWISQVRLVNLGEPSLKKNRDNLGKIPKGGGGVKKTDENSQFQFGNFENSGGGSRFFKIV